MWMSPAVSGETPPGPCTAGEHPGNLQCRCGFGARGPLCSSRRARMGGPCAKSQDPPGRIELRWPGTKRYHGLPFPIWPIFRGVPLKSEPFSREGLAAGTQGRDVFHVMSFAVGLRARHSAFPWVLWAGLAWPGFPAFRGPAAERRWGG